MKRIGILFGGKSAEHEISLLSAKNIFEAMDREKFEPVLIGIDKKGRWLINDADKYLLNADNPSLVSLNPDGKPVVLRTENTGMLHAEGAGNIGLDAVFPVLHGPFGEDGAIQGFLKLADIPYAGPAVLGSAVGMDKDAMKRLLRDAGIPIGKFLVLKSHEKPLPFGEVQAALSPVNESNSPFFIKPANMGSSVGISKVRNEAEYYAALKEAFLYDTKIIIEEFIPGREIECAVLGNEEPKASIPGEIIPAHDFYSYEAKYLDEKGAALEIPAKLDEQTIRRVQELAIKVFKTLCCEGLARVDFFLGGASGRRELIVNEINTMPGFTRISMYPKLWEASGIGYTELITRLIELAISRFEKERLLKTSVI
ncbi:MAG: D-alanine--D-alanine ligase [Treponema sp.]|jgi:D-alanine-D-alanine ligase|nr:D-alanine--D-alanine ligase [Treponema sp.]